MTGGDDGHRRRCRETGQVKEVGILAEFVCDVVIADGFGGSPEYGNAISPNDLGEPLAAGGGFRVSRRGRQIDDQRIVIGPEARSESPVQYRQVAAVEEMIDGDSQDQVAGDREAELKTEALLG